MTLIERFIVVHEKHKFITMCLFSPMYTCRNTLTDLQLKYNQDYCIVILKIRFKQNVVSKHY